VADHPKNAALPATFYPVILKKKQERDDTVRELCAQAKSTFFLGDSFVPDALPHSFTFQTN